MQRKIIDLINVDASDIKYKISNFPDGENQLEILSEIDHKCVYQVKCRIRNAEELFIIMQLDDILSRHGVTYLLKIYYLFTLRNDRVMDFNKPFNLNIVKKVLMSLNTRHIFIVSQHSDVALEGSRIVGLHNTIYNWMKELTDGEYDCIIFPDEGALTKYKYKYMNCPLVGYCVKHRDAEGNIDKYELKWVDEDNLNLEKIKNSGDIKKIAVIDDLCDGGRTFVLCSEAIKQVFPEAIRDLYITHAVQTSGVHMLCSTYHNVHFCDTYQDTTKYYKNLGNMHIKELTKLD